MTMRVTSSAFDDGAKIPKRHTGEGTDVSPPLRFEGVPPGTKELALTCDDPDAPRAKPWVHWVLYGLAPDCTGLLEGQSGGGAQGKNDFGRTGYGGPMPPPGHGVHHYHFKLHALKEKLGLEPGLGKDDLLAAMRGKIVAEAELVGTYERR